LWIWRAVVVVVWGMEMEINGTGIGRKDKEIVPGI